MKEFLDLDKRDREILSLLEQYPEMSQSDMAEKLKISQPSISARIYKLKKKGLVPCCWHEPEKSRPLYGKSRCRSE